MVSNREILPLKNNIKIYKDTAMETVNDKYSIKSLLFTKAIPNYVIPAHLTACGHKVYACTDCGDKFVFESSYNDHVNRKSVQISYMCRYCSQKLVFFNRCNLLFHIRSHVSRTATINVTDLNIEPLPASYFKVNKPPGPKPPPVSSSNMNAPLSTQPPETPHQVASASSSNTKSSSSTKPAETPRKMMSMVHCFECKRNITLTGVAYKDRARHLMQYTNEVYSCPICLFALPTTCALKTHIRIHIKMPPFYCPECGIQLTNKNTSYPYHHDCEGFKMLRATARLSCIVPDCRPLHPNHYKEHMKEFHLKRVYKCPYCVVACFNESTMVKHQKDHTQECKPLLFYQCEVCPGKFVAGNHLDGHLQTHASTAVFPCWPCGTIFKDVNSLINHYIKKESKSDVLNNALKSIRKEYDVRNSKQTGVSIYRVVKLCDKCKRSFTYRCKYKEISELPNECPYKCTSLLESNVTPEVINRNAKITCHLCKAKISQNWAEVKKHYARFHKTYKCLDPKILVNRTDIKRYLRKDKHKHLRSVPKTLHKKITKRTKKCQILTTTVSSIEVNEDIQSTSSINVNKPSVNGINFECNMCPEHFNDKQSLEKHMISHRDPCMAYQCMECGQSFVVKPTFAKHLLLEHNITDIDDYIMKKQCYNEIALFKYQHSIVSSNEPVSENQCRICREEFSVPEDLEKHFRVHGMAFLLKNNSNKNK